MKIIETISDIGRLKKGCVLTVGNFDGVHLGHQKILAAAKRMAVQATTELVAMTFDPHPVAVLRPDKGPGVLTPLAIKCRLLAGRGVDCLVVLKSTPGILSLSPEDFVDRFCVAAIGPSVVVEGHDFNFGAARAGNIQTLQTLGAAKGFNVCVVEARTITLETGETVRVSSTMIRNLLESGRLSDAAFALGRPYRLIGQVIPGQGKGKQLGFPTANLEPGPQIIPAEGVYAGTVEIADDQQQVLQSQQRLPAALSIGRAETLGTHRPQAIEAHLLIENIGQLTGKWLALDFVRQLRSQIRFDTEEQLAEQIAMDCKNVRQLLAADNESALND